MYKMSDSNTLPDMCLKSFVAGEREEAERLLEQVEEPQLLKDKEKGGTILHWAARWGWYETVKKLVENYNFDSLVRSNNGSVPLLYACFGGCLKTIQYLIEQCECDPMCKRNNGWTPFHSACAGGNVNVVKFLITQYKCDPMCKNNDDITPLHSVCHNSGNLDVLSYLVNECNCDPMSKSNDGWTPFHSACAEGYVDVVKYLITQCRCNPMCKTNSGETPLHSVCLNSGNLDVLSYLVNECNCDPMSKSNDGLTPLHFACAGGNVNVVKYLITQCRCDPKCKANSGITPLHSVCCNSGNLDILSYLVNKCNFDPMCQSNDGQTPLHSACSGGNVNVVKYLITQCRCDPMCKTNSGITPLHSVCQKSGNLDVLGYLVNECNCDPMSQSNDGLTPLHFACSGGNVNVVKYLISKCGCDPMCKANNGWTPLHSVCQKSGNLDVVRYLIEECKCDPMCKDKSSETPFHFACRKGHYEIAEYFFCYGAVDPAFKNFFSMSPSFLSKDNMMKLLYNKFSKHSSCLDIESYIKIFLLGDSGVGKTTLTEVIKRRANGVVFGWLKQVSGVELHTAGIVPHRLEHRELGNIILHDLAGQPEYYSSHIAVLENILQGSAAVFIVVVKLSDDAPYRWLSLVKDLSSRCSSTCYVLTVASHKDAVDQSLREQFRQKLEDRISSFLKGKKLQSMGTVYLDCRKLGSKNFTVFKHSLSAACQSVQSTLSHKKMLSCDKMYCRMLHLLMENKRVSFYTTDTLLKIVRESSHEYLLPETEDKFLLSLYHLHFTGLLMFINTPGGSWVVFESRFFWLKSLGKYLLHQHS